MGEGNNYWINFDSSDEHQREPPFVTMIDGAGRCALFAGLTCRPSTEGF